MNEQEIETGSFADFMLRFDELQKEAYAFGITSVIGLSYHDQFIGESDYSFQATGEAVTCYGLSSLLNREMGKGF